MVTPELPEIDYGHWPSPLTPASLFATTEAISWLRPATRGLFFLLSLPEESNAIVLMYLADDGAKKTRVSPPGMNLRSQVHEYGGIPYTFTDGMVFYCNFSDQRVYRQSFDPLTQNSGAPEAITPLVEDSPKALRYIDFIVDEKRQRLICVREDHRNAQEPRNSLVALSMNGTGEGDALFAASDFVASPCISPDGRHIAFQAWSHPNMPWDDTEIWLGTFDADGKLQQLNSILAGRPGAIEQPAFSPQGDLYFIADWTDWWNLYRIDNSRLTTATHSDAYAVLAIDAELCSAQWQFGQHQYDFVDADTLLLSLNRNCVWQLATLNVQTRQLTILCDQLGRLEHVFSQSGNAVFYAAPIDGPGAICTIDLHKPEKAMPIFRGRSVESFSEAAAISAPQHFAYGSAGSQAFALYYPPCNPHYRALANSLPPLLVSVHGGPTSSANSAYNPAVQFWTSRGFGWLDVNHRGSTGYGRKFRRSLYGEWGVVDIEDIVGAVEHLIASGGVDPQRIAIRGASAGGYAVLAALAGSDIFSAGVSYYGIGDLELLAKDTHKFESRYIDQLIGPYPAMAEIYRARSPIHHIHNITSPVLLLQGMQDKVVPPNQAETIYQKLKTVDSRSRCVYFAEEGHGFRKPQNQVAALQAELDFYNEIFL
ncbi:MAG: prolyl oligopeptidase family serine peptidase [Pseudomonadota bacterium]